MKERSKRMFYGDYSYELAMERIEADIKAHEQDRLGKQLRSAPKGLHTKSMVARAAAFTMALFIK
jgi:hypothetical protein